jgi:hypothetical protein
MLPNTPIAHVANVTLGSLERLCYL